MQIIDDIQATYDAVHHRAPLSEQTLNQQQRPHSVGSMGGHPPGGSASGVVAPGAIPLSPVLASPGAGGAGAFNTPSPAKPPLGGGSLRHGRTNSLMQSFSMTRRSDSRERLGQHLRQGSWG